MPVYSTNKIPHSALRSSSRRRPGCRNLRSGIGSSGSISSHRLSSTSQGLRCATPASCQTDRKSTRLNSSHVEISYAVFCLKKKKKKKKTNIHTNKTHPIYCYLRTA